MDLDWLPDVAMLVIMVPVLWRVCSCKVPAWPVSGVVEDGVESDVVERIWRIGEGAAKADEDAVAREERGLGWVGVAEEHKNVFKNVSILNLI